MKIRLATQDDLPVLAKLVGFFWDEQEKRFGMPRMDASTLALIHHGIITDQAVFVAQQGEDIIGWTARVMAPGLPPGLAVGVAQWVFEPYRKERVGSDMTREADAHAARMGATMLSGEVAKDNVAGLRAALAQGWVIVGYAIRKRLERPARDEEAAA